MSRFGPLRLMVALGRDVANGFSAHEPENFIGPVFPVVHANEGSEPCSQLEPMAVCTER